MSSIVWNHASSQFGFQCCSEHFKNEKHKTGRAITIILGWIPIIGTIIGIFRVLIGITSYRKEMQKQYPNENKLMMCKALIARGVAEILCLGPLLAIIDIVMTLARCCIPLPESSS